jgi:hypothetical protein
MKTTIVLLAIVSALALATAAMADPGPATGDATSISNMTGQGWTYLSTGTFLSGISGEGSASVLTYYENFTETTPEPGFPSGEGAVRMWDYVVLNNTNNIATGSAFLLRSFSLTYPTGVSVPDIDDMTTSAPSWIASTTGQTANFATTEGSGAEIIGGGQKQFLVETRQTPIVLAALPASVQNGHAFNGYVSGPGNVVPEPMSVLLGCLGLTGIVGFRRIRR